VFVLIAVASRIRLYGIIPFLLGALTSILTLYYALLWFFPYLADRLIARRYGGLAATLIFPAAAVSAEYVNTVLYGSWGSVAHSQFNNLPLIQLSSLVGMWGVTFIVMWFASVANWVWEKGLDWRPVRKGALVYSSILSLVLLYGGVRLAVFPPRSQTVTVASLTASGPIQDYLDEATARGFTSSVAMAAADRASLSELLGTLHTRVFAGSERLAASGASLILWPEAMVRVLEEDEAPFIDRGRRLAREKGVYLLMAYFVLPKDDPASAGQNKAVLIDPSGTVQWQYLKTHPVPGSTDKPGSGVLPVADTPFGRVSTAICYDMDFTGLLHQAGRKKVDIMLVPAWDWKAIDPLHARMAAFRAIENGFSMVRQTGDGLSLAVDYQGRTAAAMDHFTSADHTMVSRVPIEGVRTVYTVIGDAFAWLCLTGLLAGIIRSVTTSPSG
jgi:apolipoprotein N-acyltransferase